MKTRHFLIAALLLGGMTAFNACSEKDAIDDVTPPIDQPAEELETVMALTGGFGDNVQTRADGEDVMGRDNDYETIRCYGEYVFEVENNVPGKFLGSYIQKSDKGEAIFKKGDLNTSDSYGFYFHPLKFKTAAKKVAVVVVANCDNLFNATPEEGVLTDFDSFVKFANEATLPLIKSNTFAGYPMSSNVKIVDIEPGMYNTVGFGNNSDGEKELQTAFQTYDLTYSKDKIHNSNQSRIYLYRCWSLVKLTELSVATYADNASDARFELEEVFLMNVPTRTHLFNTASTLSWYAWGGELNIDLDDLIADTTPAFYSGFADDEGATTNKEHSDKYKEDSAYDYLYRTKAFADATEYYPNYNRSLLKNPSFLNKVSVSGEDGYSQKLQLDGDTYRVKGTSVVANPAMGEDNFFTYVVAPSTYGKDEATEPIYDQSVVLVVKGKYSQKIGGAWFGIGKNGEVEPSYYTVVVNDNAKVAGLQTQNIENTVMRNVQYEISMVVKGPGSPTPVAHLANTVIVPKITVVKFGTVRQHSEID